MSGGFELRFEMGNAARERTGAVLFNGAFSQAYKFYAQTVRYFRCDSLVFFA